MFSSHSSACWFAIEIQFGILRRSTLRNYNIGLYDPISANIYFFKYFQPCSLVDSQIEETSEDVMPKSHCGFVGAEFQVKFNDSHGQFGSNV